MEILYKNTTKYTKQAYDEFLKFHQAKYGFKNKLYTILAFVFLIFCICVNIQEKIYSIAIFFAVILIGYTVYKLYHPHNIIKKEKSSEKITEEKEFTFTFYEKYFTLKGENMDKKVKYRWIRKVFENSNYYYLYISDSYAFVLNKKTFSVGNSNKFLPFIKAKTFFKSYL